MPFNRLTPAEAERLALLSEELGEVTQAIGKILRHGFESRGPSGETNRERLEAEVGDLKAALTLMLASGDVSHDAIEIACETKLTKVWRYLHHQMTDEEAGREAAPCPEPTDIRRDPVHQSNGLWYFYNETWVERHGPYRSEAYARAKLGAYLRYLNGEAQCFSRGSVMEDSVEHRA